MADTKYFKHISTHLDSNGDGSGDHNANGDYSLGEEIFYIQPPEDENYEIHRIIVSIEDTSGMQASEYGNLATALATGVKLRLQDDTGTILDFTNGDPITTNAQWSALCYDVDIKTWGAGNELLVARLTFKHFGQPVLLRGRNNERLEAVFNDNLSGLIEHHFMVQGLNISVERDILHR